MSLNDSQSVPSHSLLAGVLVSRAAESGRGRENFSSLCAHNPGLPDSIRTGWRTCLEVCWLHLQALLTAQTRTLGSYEMLAQQRSSGERPGGGAV